MASTKKKYQAAVIGSGPGGYPAAIRLAQAGKKVALIEATEIGGTCLNRGCIPTKTLLANASVLNSIRHADAYGIRVGDVAIDWTSMMQRKNEVVKKLRGSLEGLIASNGIDIIRGKASFISASTLAISAQDGSQILIEADDIIIATGSEPKDIGKFPFDGKYIHSSTSLLELERLPESIIIIGGGVIGCEFASMLSDFGVSVTIVEALERLLPLECDAVSAQLTKSFVKRGVKVVVGKMVQGIKLRADSSGVAVELSDGAVLQASCALVSVGRSFNSNALGLEATAVQVDRGAIVVDEGMRTTAPHIWAIGDVAGKSMYAHVATHQGIVAAENILGHQSRMNYDAIPGVIFTRPEIGSVGMSLESAKKRGFKAILVTYPLQGLGKAQAELHTEGFAQVVVEIGTGRILGAQVVGHEAGNLIAQMAIAIANELTIESITETIHAHPTMSEVWLEAAFIVQDLPLHFPKQMLGSVKKTG